MQDRFVGDIGDFGKYGLLRALTGLWDWERAGPLPESERLSLGVVWCVPDKQTIAETPAGHGQNVGYLFNEATREQFRDCDPALFDFLKNIICGKRSLDAVEQSEILNSSDNSAFYRETIPRNGQERKCWLESALQSTKDKHIVFLDPDIGLAPPSKPYERKDSPKYIYPEEVQEFLDCHQTVVAYQHHARTDSHVKRQRINWSNALGKSQFDEARILCFEKRDFIILPAAKHAKTIDERLAKMLAGPWCPHFKRYPPSRIAFRDA